MKLRKMMSLLLATGLLAGSLAGCAASVASATPEQASNDVEVATVEAVALEEAIKMTTTDEIQPGVNAVNFKSQGANLAGVLFTPADFDATKTYPTVVFSGPLLQVKEQMGTAYGKVFAEKGYVFLAFDHIGHGESEGDMGPHENGNLKTEGIRDAISFVRTLEFVNKDRLFGLGGCASGGYMPLVAVTDKRLKSIATVSGMNSNIAAYLQSMPKEQFVAMMLGANEARQTMYETGELITADTMGYEGKEIEEIPAGASREGYEYYMTERGRTENYSHRAKANFMEYSPLLDATTYAPYLYMPYIGIVGEKAQTAPLTQMFYDRVEEPKELVVIKGATHVSLYDNVDQIKEAVDRMDAFWTANVK